METRRKEDKSKESYKSILSFSKHNQNENIRYIVSDDLKSKNLTSVSKDRHKDHLELCETKIEITISLIIGRFCK